MYSQSGAATHEIYQIFNPFQPRIREIVEDEPDVKICHSCGQLDTRQSCDCDAQTRVRRYIAEQFLKMDFVWMSNDVLKCDEHTLRNYTYILFFYSPSQEFMQLLKEAHIYNYADC